MARRCRINRPAGVTIREFATADSKRRDRDLDREHQCDPAHIARAAFHVNSQAR